MLVERQLFTTDKVIDVTIAEDGQEAVEIVQKALGVNSNETAEDASAVPSAPTTPTSPFNVIFMDIQMPRMDGIEATRGIRGLGCNTPIVALTAFTDESNREACSNVGMQDFLGKPIKRPALKEILTKVKEGLHTGVPSSPEASPELPE